MRTSGLKKRTRLKIVAIFVIFALAQLLIPRHYSFDSSISQAGQFEVLIKTTASDEIYEQVRFDTNPSHIWNRLYRQFFTRTSRDGQKFGIDASDPLFWYETKYLINNSSYEQAVSVLNEFIANNSEKLISDPLKRAVFQHDLWTVFDWLCLRSDLYSTQRRELQKRLVIIIKRLALSKAQIRTLPNNYLLAAATESFPNHYDPVRRNSIFLPSDLFNSEGDWVSVSNRQGGVVALSHMENFSGRSSFLVIVKLPGGRMKTIEYLKQLREFSRPWVIANNRSSSAPLILNPQTPQFPPGTMMALVRQMILIDSDGELTLSPITESIQILVHNVVFGSDKVNLASESLKKNDAYKFNLSRTNLLSGGLGGLRPVQKTEKEFIMFLSNGIDGFETSSESSRPEQFQEIALNACSRCHSSPGVVSFLSYSRHRFSGEYTQPPLLLESDPTNESFNTIQWKKKQFDWGLLVGLWGFDAETS